MQNLQSSRIIHLPDEILDSIFTDLGYDGVWSSLTRLLSFVSPLFIKNKTVLGRSWVLKPQNFRCPICAKNKCQIIKSRYRLPILTLHIDHDHISDFIFYKSKLLGAGGAVGPVSSKHWKYKPTAMCPSCNWIDSRLKRAYPEVCPFFSLSLDQKKGLLGLDGGLDLKLARDVWHDEKSCHYDRLKSIECDLQDKVNYPEPLIKFKPAEYFEMEARWTFERTTGQAGCSYGFEDFLERSLQPFEGVF